MERKMGLQKSVEQDPIARQKQMVRIVDAVFSNEAVALQYPKERVNGLRMRYEDYVSSMTATVTDQVSSLKNEREVFEHLSSVFYSNFDYAKKTTVMTGLELNPPAFNCYGSSLMFADVMARLGVPFQVAIVPKHVFLVGEKYRFETTIDEGDVLMYRKDIPRAYPSHSIGGLDFLLAASYGSVGLRLMNENSNAEAIEMFKKSLEINPKNADIHYDLGLSYWREEEYSSAIASFKKSLEIDDSNGDAYYGIGVAYYGNNEFKRAISNYEVALKKKKTTPNSIIYDSMAKTYEMLGDSVSAKKYHRMAGSK